MAETVIETKGLSKAYKGAAVLHGLDLKVTKGSIVGFLGPNGAGKSTTIKLLLGLIKPTSGSGTVFGLDLGRDTVSIRERVGYLAQDPRFYPHMTARETLRFVSSFFYTLPSHAVEERITETLELVGLLEKADRPIKGFSGGERQRLGIAQAQINHPELLILDEPAAALDPMGRRDVLMIMERLRHRTTIFYSTHILEDVQRVSDSVAILNEGRLIAQAPTIELLKGSGQAVYSVMVKGDDAGARARVRSLPWVTKLQVEPVEGQLRWEVTVADPGAAEELLVAEIMADGRARVTNFGRRIANLEEVFVNLVGGGNHAG